MSEKRKLKCCIPTLNRSMDLPSNDIGINSIALPNKWAHFSKSFPASSTFPLAWHVNRRATAITSLSGDVGCLDFSLMRNALFVTMATETNEKLATAPRCLRLNPTMSSLDHSFAPERHTRVAAPLEVPETSVMVLSKWTKVAVGSL